MDGVGGFYALPMPLWGSSAPELPDRLQGAEPPLPDSNRIIAGARQREQQREQQWEQQREQQHEQQQALCQDPHALGQPSSYQVAEAARSRFLREEQQQQQQQQQQRAGRSSTLKQRTPMPGPAPPGQPGCSRSMPQRQSGKAGGSEEFRPPRGGGPRFHAKGFGSSHPRFARNTGFEAQEVLAPLGNAMLAGYHTGGAPVFTER
jgi:hypothetical protein